MYEGRLQPSPTAQLPARQMSAGLDALSLGELLGEEAPLPARLGSRPPSGRVTPVPPPGALERASSLTAALPQPAAS